MNCRGQCGGQLCVDGERLITDLEPGRFSLLAFPVTSRFPVTFAPVTATDDANRDSLLCALGGVQHKLSERRESLLSESDPGQSLVDSTAAAQDFGSRLRSHSSKTHSW